MATEKILVIADEEGFSDFKARITDDGYLYLIQSFRDICLAPQEALKLRDWLVATYSQVEPGSHDARKV